jgi:hypothetical protein
MRSEDQLLVEGFYLIIIGLLTEKFMDVSVH